MSPSPGRKGLTAVLPVSIPFSQTGVRELSPLPHQMVIILPQG